MSFSSAGKTPAKASIGHAGDPDIQRGAQSETFKAAKIDGAVTIVVSHNHPSGDPAPSSADLAVTRALREASRILGIALLDHVIVRDKRADPAGVRHYSFRQAGLP